MASQGIYLADFLLGGQNFISRVYCLATIPMSGYMPRNCSDLKSAGGGDNSYA